MIIINNRYLDVNGHKPNSEREKQLNLNHENRDCSHLPHSSPL
jgi:hypothetical protein